jgi:hypothetical protein
MNVPKLSKQVKMLLGLAGTTVFTYILHFPFGLLENAIYQYITDNITGTFAMPITTFIIYGLSFVVSALIIYGAYKLGTLEKRGGELLF